MKQSLTYFSLATVIVLSAGCGGSSGSSDTTPPVITNTTLEFNVDAGKEKRVPLTANEEIKSYTEDSAEAMISDANLVFDAPNFSSSGENKYTVSVVAEDKAGNKSTPKVFIFNVKANITESYEYNSSYIAPIGDKSFTKVGGFLKDPSGLLWDDVVSTVMSYDGAKAYCENKGTGWRIPTRAEFLNIIDYSKVTTTGSLIDSDFSNYSADSIEVSWVENLTADKYVVQHPGGADTTIGNDIDHNVLCVYGDKNMAAHTFTPIGSDYKDNVTGLTWKKIDTTQPSEYSDAENGCTGEWHLPTINELRSIIDYNTNTITRDIATDLPNGSNPNTYYIWSSTSGKNSNGNPTHYTIFLDGNYTKAGVIYDENNMSHYYTCVK